MFSVLDNFYQNVLFAWKFGISSWEEPEVWTEKVVEIISLNPTHSFEHRSFSNRFWDVAKRIYQMARNTSLFKEATVFEVAERELSGNKGTYRSVIYYPTFFQSYLFVTDPNVMKRVLSHGRNETGTSALFSGGGPTKISKLILGENLLSYNHEKHKNFKKSITPFLKFNNSFYLKFEKLIQVTLKKWIESHKEEPISFLPNLIVSSICNCYFNYEEDIEDITASVNTLLSKISNRDSDEYQRAAQVLDESAKRVIEKLKTTDLNRIEQAELLTFVKLMFFAGQDTTSAFLEYMIYILGNSKKAKKFQEKIYMEWKESQRELIDFAKESTTLDAVFKEGIRLHPPSFEQTRETVQALVLDRKMFIPPRTQIHLNHLYSQRDRRRWGIKSQDFVPSRFLQGEKQSPYYPFSLGPTICLGKQFSLALSKIFIMKLISEYTWETISEFNGLGGSIALKITPDVKVRLVKRG